MVVGVCRVEVFVPESISLKTKRRALTSLKQRIRNKFNVSVAEVDNYEKWQRISLGIAMVSNQHGFVDRAVGEILKLIESDSRVEILEHSVELF